MNNAGGPDAPNRADVAPNDPRQSPHTTSFLRDIPLPIDEPVPTRVGGYRILRILGYGGMGTVYEAEQESTRRFVAIKLIHPHLATARYRRRFAEEIRTLGKFEHPGIARIHDAGAAPDDSGVMRLYFAMELVAGLRVDEHVARHALDPRAIAALMATVCDAAHHAHQKSVIHCDLTPANVLIASDGSPKILDFGIARILGDEARETTIATRGNDHASIVGTLAFASPEQAAGNRNHLDVLTDVYGLGAVLYALLAGRPPHDLRACGLAEAARIVQDVQPMRIGAVREGIPADLETIVAKAIAHSPRERYDSAAALAADLRRFVDGRPILARRAPWREVCAKWVRRNRLVSTSIGITVAALLVAAVGAVLASVRLNALAQRVLDEQGFRDNERSATRGVNLPLGARFQWSAIVTEHLLADEAPGFPGRVLAAQNWNKATVGGQASGALLALDARGNVVASLDGPRAWSAWARPAFDLSGRFDEAIGVPRASVTLAACVANCDGDPARELVRGLRISDEHLHMAILEIDHVDSVVHSRGALASTATQLWSHGDFHDVVWDDSRRLLWTLSNAEDLAWYVPELAAWDSSRCPGGCVDPRILLAIDVAALGPPPVRRVLPPLRGDDDHPPVQAKWAFTTRPPRAVRAASDGDRGRSATTAPGSNRSGSLCLHIQAFEPSAADDNRGLGRLHVVFRHATVDKDVIASVDLDSNGTPHGRFELERIQDEQADEAGRALVEQFDPAQEILALDLAVLQAARSQAERLLDEHRDTDTALAAVAALPGLSSGQRDEVARCIRAMTSNWRWLWASAAEVVERREAIAAIGAPADVDKDAQAAAATARAVQRLEKAARLHTSRCPTHGDGTCVYDWFLESELALALAAAGEWSECEAAARRAIALPHQQLTLGDKDPIDHAILAIALSALQRDAEADEELAIAERDEGDPSAPSSARQDGSARLVAPRLLARARELLGGG
ncbi:MAG: serine/threonine-protein kinase [Phycisphaerales bacterium]